MVSNMIECVNNVLKGDHWLSVSAVVECTFFKLNRYFRKHSQKIVKWVGDKFLKLWTYFETVTFFLEHVFLIVSKIMETETIFIILKKWKREHSWNFQTFFENTNNFSFEHFLETWTVNKTWTLLWFLNNFLKQEHIWIFGTFIWIC